MSGGRRSLLGIRVLLAGLLAATALPGAATELRGELFQVSSRPRWGAPVEVDLVLAWLGSGLLTGRAELVVAQPPFNTLRSNEIAVMPGTVRRRLMLPAHFLEESSGVLPDQVEIDLSFITGGVRHELGRHVLSFPAIGRQLVIGMVRSRLAGPAASDVWHSFACDQVLVEQEMLDYDYDLRASPLPVTAGELGTDPLAYCRYDLLVITRAALAELGPRQVRALEAWVRAGGSICFLLSGGGPGAVGLDAVSLSQAQVRAVNRCAGDRGPVMTCTADGCSLLVADTLLARHDLGRVVVVADAGQEIDCDRQAWQRAVAFLWQVRRRHWPGSERSVSSRYGYGEMTVRSVTASLMPDNLRLVPFKVVAGGLALFVLLIGYVDYKVLGWLRLRRLTWVTFPLMAILLTGLSLLLIRQYLGTRHQSRVVEVIDLGRDGQVVRSNRLEMVFSAGSRTLSREIEHGLCSPFGRSWPAGTRQIILEGAVPQHYTITQEVLQWTFWMIRTLTIGAAGQEPVPGVLGGTWHPVNGRFPLLSAVSDDQSLPGVGLGMSNGRVVGELGYQDYAELVEAVSILRDGYYEQLLVAGSPAADSGLRDLPIHDPTDPNEALLVVVEEREDRTVIYRKLSRTEP